MRVRAEKGLKGEGLRRVSRMRVRAEKGNVKDDG